MTGFVEAVRACVDNRCIENECLDKGGCTVPLDHAPQSRLVIDFDKPGSPRSPSQKRCDYLFIADTGNNGGWVVPLEFKNSGLNVSKVVKQLKSGAKVAADLVPKNKSITFRPLAVIGGPINRATLKMLKKQNNLVPFRQRSEAVRVIKCGNPLTKALGPSRR